FLASWVIGRFEGTLERLVALAVLMPIVASMGGVAGTQTLTLMVRGMALGQVGMGNVGALLDKEVLVGLLNGFVWAVVVGVVAALGLGCWLLGVLTAAAMVIILVTAALSGVGVSLLLRRLCIGRALAGGLVLTPVTDVMGFFSFLGLATLVLLSALWEGLLPR